MSDGPRGVVLMSQLARGLLLRSGRLGRERAHLSDEGGS